MNNLKKFNVIMSPENFKNRNKDHWIQNTPYWTQNDLRQIIDTADFLKNKLLELPLTKSPVKPFIIYDFGFGNCWLLDLLKDLNVNFKYIGFDFNEKFIELYSEKYRDMENVSFILQDLEEPLEDKFLNQADYVFTLFTLFEIPQPFKVFDNISNVLKNNGHHIMLSIDSFYLMLALSNDMTELKTILKMFDDYKSQGQTPYFFQDIDLGDGTSQKLKYASVLYTTSDYLKFASKVGLDLNEFDELIKTNKFMPKIYQYYDFIKR